MGNHQQHQQLQTYITQLQVVNKNSNYTILKDKQGKEYIKILYLDSPDEKQYRQLRATTKTNSIFNKKYLEFRYKCQNQQQILDFLPKILTFGEENQDSSTITCTITKLNFVVFEHPLKTLKLQIEERISSGTFFKQNQLLNLIKSVTIALNQLYFHVKSWNQEILQRKGFVLSEENIFIDQKGKILISDVVSNLGQIQSALKQQVTLRKTSRNASCTNLHSKINCKKVKQKYFQTNFMNLALIIEGIIFKFQCFSQPQKNSLHQSQSLSTALQSHRGSTKNMPNYSIELQNLINYLHQIQTPEHIIIERINQLIENSKMNEKQKSQQISKLISRKNSSENMIKEKQLKDKLKLNAINSHPIQFGKAQILAVKAVKQNQVQTVNPFSQLRVSSQLQGLTISKPNTKNIRENHEEKSHQRNINTKIRLSLKKDSSRIALQQIQNKQNVVQHCRNINRKNSHLKFLCLKTAQTEKMAKKANLLQNKVDSADSLQRKRSQSLNYQIPNKLFNKKSQKLPNSAQIIEPEKKKVFLRKPYPLNCRQQKENQQNITKKQAQNGEQGIHLNPISRKKSLGFNRQSNLRGHQNLMCFKTVQKGVNQCQDIQMIQNLSSIISNHNNTLSSNGNPLTEQFKTEISQIEDEGCIGFTDIEFCYKDGTGQFSKKTTQALPQSTASVKLSSYPSIQLVESILERTEDKIPQFLKKYNLPSKHLLALNNIILKQKDMIIEQSFQQSQFNSIRNSLSNILAQEDPIELRKRRQSKVLIEKMAELQKIAYKSQPNNLIFQNLANIAIENSRKYIEPSSVHEKDKKQYGSCQKQSIFYIESQSSDNASLSHQLKNIEFSLINGSGS